MTDEEKDIEELIKAMYPDNPIIRRDLMRIAREGIRIGKESAVRVHDAISHSGGNPLGCCLKCIEEAEQGSREEEFNWLKKFLLEAEAEHIKEGDKAGAKFLSEIYEVINYRHLEALKPRGE